MTKGTSFILDIFWQTRLGALHRLLLSLTLLEKLVLSNIVILTVFTAPKKLEIYQDTSSTRHAYFSNWCRSFSSRVALWFMLLKEQSRNALLWKMTNNFFMRCETWDASRNLNFYQPEITKASVTVLSAVLPSLRLLKRLLFHHIPFGSTSEEQLFTAVDSLGFWNELNISFSRIAQTGATTFYDISKAAELKIRPRRIENGEDDGTPKTNLMQTASFLPIVHE